MFSVNIIILSVIIIITYLQLSSSWLQSARTPANMLSTYRFISHSYLRKLGLKNMLKCLN